jgi:acyl-CoA thioesterase
MNVEERHHNSMGTAHGGAIFSLADFCFGAAANSRGNVAMSINASISYIKAIGSGTLFAEAQEVAVHPRLATYIVTLTNEAGETLAVFQGTAYRKRDRVPGMES